MSVKLRKLFAKIRVDGKKDWTWLRHTLALVWIEVRYGVEQWVLTKTWKFRAKHTKRFRLFSMAYNQPQSSWDDVEVADQWGLWLPCGFGIVSKANFDFDQMINRDIGQPEDEWKDFVDGDWPTYYYKDEFLNHNHYFDAARKNLKAKLGASMYDKEIEVRLFVQSQKSLDDDLIQQAEWVAGGSKPFKISFADGAKEDFKELFGEEAANEIIEDAEKRNKEIDESP